ncbi:hypothetical protein E1286_46670 [Nonomuraea terrae]|uniref:ATP-binding protein n=1 Tax=Nonomuraea terrae TaxID=2530383 RepID=A0A4R4XE61_9ACTN|nr:ATP-binding protein [Nonomuraea terrae]TDD28996.1 hypothetical protein E1286_46670 [Nonomuraea terrae]
MCHDQPARLSMDDGDRDRCPPQARQDTCRSTTTAQGADEQQPEDCSVAGATWTLPPWPVSVTWARHLVRGQLLVWGWSQACDVAELLASELVTNAVRHAAGLVLLTLWVVDGVLRCEVGDGSQQLPVRHAAAEDDEGWRGLALVEELSAAWGTSATRWGKVVWFEMPLSGGPCERAAAFG